MAQRKNSVPSVLLRGVEFNSGFNIQNFTYDPNFGFICRKQKEKLTILGAAAIGAEWALDQDDEHTYTPLTILHYLPDSAQQFKRQCMGVGPRLYNYPCGPASWDAGSEREIGMFTVMLNSYRQKRVMDSRKISSPYGGVVGWMKNHLRGQTAETSRVVRNVHNSYGLYDAVIRNVDLQEFAALGSIGAQYDEGVEVLYTLIRNPRIRFVRVGTVIGVL